MFWLNSNIGIAVVNLLLANTKIFNKIIMQILAITNILPLLFSLLSNNTGKAATKLLTPKSKP